MWDRLTLWVLKVVKELETKLKEMDGIKEMIRPRRRKMWGDSECKGQRVDGQELIKEKSHDNEEINGVSLRLILLGPVARTSYAHRHGLDHSL